MARHPSDFNQSMRPQPRGALLLIVIAISLILLVNAASAARPAGLPVALEVDDNVRVDGGHVRVGFNATSEEDAVIKYQLGFQDNAACEPVVKSSPGHRMVRLETDEDQVFARSVSPGHSEASSVEGKTPQRALFTCHGPGEANKVILQDEADPSGVHWGAVMEQRLPSGKTFGLEAVMNGIELGHPVHLADLPDGRFVIRVWEDGGSDPVILDVGESYDPPSSGTLGGNASALILQNASFVLVGAAAKTQNPAQGQGQRERDWDPPLPWPFMWLFTRLRRSKILDHNVRRLVHETIQEQPGIRFSELQDQTSLPSGVLTHHLGMLQDHGFVVSVRRGRQRHLYLKGANAGLATSRLTERQEDVLALLAKKPLTQGDIAAELALSQQAVSYHLQALMDAERITRQRGAGRAWLYAVVDGKTSTLSVPTPDADSSQVLDNASTS